MITPGKGKLNAVAILAIMGWLLVGLPMYALSLLIGHKIDDEAYRTTLTVIGSSGSLVTIVLQGLNLWNNSP